MWKGAPDQNWIKAFKINLVVDKKMSYKKQSFSRATLLAWTPCGGSGGDFNVDMRIHDFLYSYYIMCHLIFFYQH